MGSPQTSFLARSLPRIRDGVAVVAAILIAFAIDAWWDEQKTATDTREALGGVEGELVENLELISAAIAADRTVMTVSDEILSLDGPSAGQLSTDSAATLIRTLFEGITLNPSEGAINSLLATGAFEEITSPELRVALAALPGVYDDQREEVDQIWVAWRRFVDRGIATGTHSSASAIARKSGNGVSPSEELLSLYVRDTQFREIIAEFGSVMDFYARELEQIEAEIESTLSLLRQEIR